MQTFASAKISAIGIVPVQFLFRDGIMHGQAATVVMAVIVEIVGLWPAIVRRVRGTGILVLVDICPVQNKVISVLFAEFFKILL